MDKKQQNEHSPRQNQSSADQHFESTPALQSIAPPVLQLKANGITGEGESDQENGAYQLKEKEFTSGAEDNPSDASSPNTPFQLKEDTVNNTGLPDNLKSGVENLSGFSLDDVKVHYNSPQPAQLQAHAYAQGSDIHIGPGQEKHLPHEAWHVVQQKQGRVQPTTQLKAYQINDDAGLEKEADVMGAKAMNAQKENAEKLIYFDSGQNKSNFQNIIQNKSLTSIIQRAEGKLDPGQNLPDLFIMTFKRLKKINGEQRSDYIQNNVLNKAIEFIEDKSIVQEIINSSNDGVIGALKGKVPELSETDMPNLASAIVNACKSSESFDEARQKAKDADNIKTNFIAKNFMDTFFQKASSAVESEIDSKFAKQARALIVSKKMSLEPIPRNEKSKFTKALKTLPLIKNLLENKKNKTSPDAKDDVNWKNGGKLSDDISYSKINDKKNEEGNEIRTKIDDGTFLNNVNLAETYLKTLIDPAIFGSITRPKVVAHLKYSSGNHGTEKADETNTFRAFCSNGEVHVAQDEHYSVIVHEVGHHIEDNNLSEMWMDIRVLMQSRHDSKSKGDKKNTAGHGSSGMKEEGRYRGDYPATGKYTSSAYEEGSTEVTSMTIEFLSDQSTLNKMLEKDPQQTAIVIRGLQPNQYKACSALRPFDKYLPYTMLH